MKIIKIAQGAYSEQGLKNANLIRFDKDARVEIFIEEYEIETHNGYISIITREDITDVQKIAMLKELCIEIANQKLRNLDASSGIQITVDGLSLQDINIDRIRWENVLDPDRGL